MPDRGECEGDDVVAVFILGERQRLELVLVSAKGESLPYRRRRHTRIPCQLSGHVVSENGSQQQAKTANLGAGGVQLLLPVPIELDEQVEVSLALASGSSIKLMGRVTGRIDAGPERGNSIEFLFRSAKERDRVAAIAEILLS